MPWTVAHQASLSMGFYRQQYWSGLPFPSPGDLSHPGIEPESPSLASGFFITEIPGKPLCITQDVSFLVCFLTGHSYFRKFKDFKSILHLLTLSFCPIPFVISSHLVKTMIKHSKMSVKNGFPFNLCAGWLWFYNPISRFSACWQGLQNIWLASLWIQLWKQLQRRKLCHKGPL